MYSHDPLSIAMNHIVNVVGYEIVADVIDCFVVAGSLVEGNGNIKDVGTEAKCKGEVSNGPLHTIGRGSRSRIV